MNAPIKVFVIPIGVVAVTFLAERVVPIPMTQFALIVVLFVDVTVQVMLPPDTVSLVRLKPDSALAL